MQAPIEPRVSCRLIGEGSEALAVLVCQQCGGRKVFAIVDSRLRAWLSDHACDAGSSPSSNS